MNCWAIAETTHPGFLRGPVPRCDAEVGRDVEIILDSGIMSGADIGASLCAGADFLLIGRAYLYGLMAGGEEGVDGVIELSGRWRSASTCS